MSHPLEDIPVLTDIVEDGPETYAPIDRTLLFLSDLEALLEISTGVCSATAGSTGQTAWGTKLRSLKVHIRSSSSAVSDGLAVRTATRRPWPQAFSAMRHAVVSRARGSAAPSR